MRKFVLASLLLGLLLFMATMHQAGIGSILETVYFFPARVIIIVFLVIFMAVGVIASLRWKVIIESQNSHPVDFFKILGARLAAFAVSYVTPAVLVGGDPVRAYMIKDDSDDGLARSFASVVIDEAIYFFTLFLSMIIGFLFLIDHFALPKIIFYSFALFTAAGIVILYLFYSRIICKNDACQEGFFIFIIKILRFDRIKYIGRRMESIIKMEKIISDFFRNKKEAFIKAFILSILEVFSYLTMIFIIITYLGVSVNFIQSLLVFSILTLASFIPIPGSFGSLEASLTFIFDLLGLGKSNGFTFSLIFRLINIVLVIIGFLALFYFELKTISRSFELETPKELLAIHKFLARIIYKRSK